MARSTLVSKCFFLLVFQKSFSERFPPQQNSIPPLLYHLRGLPRPPKIKNRVTSNPPGRREKKLLLKKGKLSKPIVFFLSHPDPGRAGFLLHQGAALLQNPDFITGYVLLFFFKFFVLAGCGAAARKIKMKS